MKKLLLLFIAFSIVHCSYAQRIVIKNVHVIPLHVYGVWENKNVYLEDGKITKISDQLIAEKGVQTIDGQGKYLLPSYTDAHIHFPDSTQLHAFVWIQLLNGVTSLRSMRGEEWHPNIPQMLEENKIPIPNLYLGSAPITNKDDLSDKEWAMKIQSIQNDRFDFIKVLSVKDEENLKSIVQYAEKFNLKMAGHYPGNISTEYLKKIQVWESIEHLGGIYQKDTVTIDQVIQLTNQKNIYHCPTLNWYFSGQVIKYNLNKRSGVVNLSLEKIESMDKQVNKFYTDFRQSNSKTNESGQKFMKRVENLEYLHQQGGKLLLSPDASGLISVPGFEIHTEMLHYHNAGISNYEILKATCYNMAEMMGKVNEWGCIKTGNAPDMILLSGNPLTDISQTRNIEGVIVNGRYYTRDFIKKQLEESL